MAKTNFVLDTDRQRENKKKRLFTAVVHAPPPRAAGTKNARGEIE